MLPESSYSSNRNIQNKVVQDVTNLGGPNVIVLENAFNDTRYQEIGAVVFWCAYYGFIEQVKLYLDANLSPFLKFYKQRNLLMAALEGGRSEIVDLLLSKEYVDQKHTPSNLKEKYLLAQDSDGNTALHFAY